MSLSSAVQSLRSSLVDLNDAVAELVMIVHEDRPSGSDLAMVDHLAEVVSELQAGVVGASSPLATITEPRQLPQRLPAIDDSLHDCAVRYWRDLRAYEATFELRRSARGRNSEWLSWLGSVESSVRRCDQPLARAQSAVRAAWQEVGELLVLYPARGDSAESHVSANIPTSIFAHWWAARSWAENGGPGAR